MPDYKFKISEGKHPIVTVVFSEKKFNILNTFLLSEARNFGKEIQNGLLKVLSGKIDSYSFSGNIFSFESDCEKTVISNDISEDDPPLKVKTSELLMLINSYKSELDNLKNKQ